MEYKMWKEVRKDCGYKSTGQIVKRDEFSENYCGSIKKSCNFEECSYVKKVKL